MDVLLVVPLISVLGLAVCTDMKAHRIPNLLVLLGISLSATWHLGFGGIEGLILWGGGALAGLMLFLPFYMSGGMAAGDVKLVSMAGSYFGASGAICIVAFSLIAGGVMGVVVLVYRRQLLRSIRRYWAMASLRTYIHPEDDDAARQRFPYAVAILLGTLASLHWRPLVL